MHGILPVCPLFYTSMELSTEQLTFFSYYGVVP